MIAIAMSVLLMGACWYFHAAEADDSTSRAFERFPLLGFSFGSSKELS